MLYLHQTITEASPKAISRRTSYLRVRLEFLRYPHLIATLFNGCAFGPPLPFTATSTWAWIDHPVSGLFRLTKRPVQTWFPFGSRLLVLNLASRNNSPDRSTKSTRFQAMDSPIHTALMHAVGREVQGSFLRCSCLLLNKADAVIRVRMYACCRIDR